jgi:hypothetical protein
VLSKDKNVCLSSIYDKNHGNARQKRGRKDRYIELTSNIHILIIKARNV